MRTDAFHVDDLSVFLRLLMPENSLVLELCLQTGLRVSDVLRIKTADFKQRMTVYQTKTKKTKRIYISKSLYSRLEARCGAVWLFPSPFDASKHRTRQAVWYDVKRASKALRVDYNAAVHSARKSYACALYLRHGGGLAGLQAVQKDLQHEFSSTTMIYLASLLLS